MAELIGNDKAALNNIAKEVADARHQAEIKNYRAKQVRFQQYKQTKSKGKRLKVDANKVTSKQKDITSTQRYWNSRIQHFASKLERHYGSSLLILEAFPNLKKWSAHVIPYGEFGREFHSSRLGQLVEESWRLQVDEMQVERDKERRLNMLTPEKNTENEAEDPDVFEENDVLRQRDINTQNDDSNLDDDLDRDSSIEEEWSKSEKEFSQSEDEISRDINFEDNYSNKDAEYEIPPSLDDLLKPKRSLSIQGDSSTSVGHIGFKNDEKKGKQNSPPAAVSRGHATSKIGLEIQNNATGIASMERRQETLSVHVSERKKSSCAKGSRPPSTLVTVDCLKGTIEPSYGANKSSVANKKNASIKRKHPTSFTAKGAEDSSVAVVPPRQASSVTRSGTPSNFVPSEHALTTPKQTKMSSAARNSKQQNVLFDMRSGTQSPVVTLDRLNDSTVSAFGKISSSLAFGAGHPIPSSAVSCGISVTVSSSLAPMEKASEDGMKNTTESSLKVANSLSAAVVPPSQVSAGFSRNSSAKIVPLEPTHTHSRESENMGARIRLLPKPLITKKNGSRQGTLMTPLDSNETCITPEAAKNSVIREPSNLASGISLPIGRTEVDDVSVHSMSSSNNTAQQLQNQPKGLASSANSSAGKKTPLTGVLKQLPNGQFVLVTRDGKSVPVKRMDPAPIKSIHSFSQKIA